LVFVLILFISWNASSQGGNIKWSDDGNAYFRIENSEIVQYTLPDNKPEIIVTRQQLTPQGSTTPLRFS
jgi:dipeptidyl-peptidase 4